MLAIKPSKQLLIGFIGLAAIMFGIVAFIYYGQSSKLHKLTTQVKKKQAQLADSRVMAERLTEIESKLMTAQADLNTLEKGVNRRAYVPTMLRQLEDLGKGVDLRVVGVRPKAPEVKPQPQPQAAADDKTKKPVEVEKPKPYDELGISIDGNGKYWDVVKFVDRITAFPKIIAVKSLQIYPLSGQAVTKGSPDLIVKLEATAFILKEPSRQEPKAQAAQSEPSTQAAQPANSGARI